MKALVEIAEESSCSAESSYPMPEFEEIFERYGRLVCRAIRRMGVPESDISDVAQEAFLVIRSKLSLVYSPESLRAFIYGIAVRQALGHRRKIRRRREDALQLVPEEHVAPSQERDVEKAEARALLKAVLERMDPDKRAIFVLYELEELEMPEVALAMGCPIQTAYSRLHAARTLVTSAFQRAERRNR